jgi:hypothetical protein
MALSRGVPGGWIEEVGDIARGFPGGWLEEQAATGGSFKPAWAINSNTIIGAGAR